MLFQQQGTDLYVDWDNGDNEFGNGSAQSPWKTITWAVKSVVDPPPIYVYPVRIHIRPTAQPSVSTYQQDPNYACPPGPNGSDYNGGEFFPIVVPPGLTLTNDPAVPGFPTLDLKDQGGVPGNPFIDVKEGILLGQTSALCGGTPETLGNYAADTVIENLTIWSSDSTTTDSQNAGSDDTKGHGIKLAPLARPPFSPLRSATV